MNPGIHLFHKPVGPTSFSVVQACMAAISGHAGGGRKPPKVCHGGTLDPFASGLLPILVGGATKLFEHLHAVPKVYEATVAWGIETDNGDPLGRATFTGNAFALTPAQLDAALAPLIGWHDQVPPVTSAKRVPRADGAGTERAFEKAHRGEAFELPPSRVYLHEAAWLAHDLPRSSRLRLSVRGGFYVRSLARDLGRQLGCGAHLSALHRCAIGPYADPGPAPAMPVSVAGGNLLPWLPGFDLIDQDVGHLRQHRPVLRSDARHVAPDWPLPEGFPAELAERQVVRGFHRQKLAFLLRRDGNHFRRLTEFPGGL